jgi:hypothetical protein
MSGPFEFCWNSRWSSCASRRASNDKSTYKQRHDTGDQVDQTLRGGLLYSEHDAGDDGDSAGENGDHVEQLHDTACEQMIEREIEGTRKEISFVRYVPPWAQESIFEAGAAKSNKAIPSCKSGNENQGPAASGARGFLRSCS